MRLSKIAVRKDGKVSVNLGFDNGVILRKVVTVDQLAELSKRSDNPLDAHLQSRLQSFTGELQSTAQPAESAEPPVPRHRNRSPPNRPYVAEKGGPMKYLIAVYDCQQRYGGPEEGGWWYDAGALVRIVRIFTNSDRAELWCRRLNAKLRSRVWGPNKGKHAYTSVLSEGELSAQVCDGVAPLAFPDRRPHYE